MQTAADRRFGSVVIQGGERTDAAFIRKITRLLKEIKQIDTGVDPPLGITLSLGEQPREVYEEWFDAGAHRYLLRIESSNPDLYRKIHPEDHSYDRRLQALYDLKEIGYQAGTGAMIGMPFQFMPNLTPREQMVKYNLYDRRTALPDGPSSLADSLSVQGIFIGYGRWGDSKHGKSGLVM